jgi:hypothetical protein
LVALLLLVACIRPGDPGVSPDDPDTGAAPEDTGPTAGEIDKRDVTLRWSWQDPWETGTCITFYLHNGGPEMAAWAMVLETEPVLADLQSVQWAHVEQMRDGALDLWSLESQILPADNNSYFEVCGEPRVRPTRIRDLDLFEEPIRRAGVAEGDLYDQDRVLQLSWLQTGRIGGGDCVQMKVVNRSWRPIGGWSLTLSYAGELRLTAATGDLVPLVRSPRVLEVNPRGEEKALIAPGGEVVGEICFDPLREPTNLTSEVQFDG